MNSPCPALGFTNATYMICYNEMTGLYLKCHTALYKVVDSCQYGGVVQFFGNNNYILVHTNERLHTQLLHDFGG